MICWFDYETTGLDPHDDIVEAAWILTDDDLRVVCERSVVVHVNVDVWREICDPVVRNMHDRNGLWEESRSAELTMSGLEAMWLADLDAHTDAHTDGSLWIPAGSGVCHFDVEKTRQALPRVFDKFTYVVYDVGVVRRMWERAGAPTWRDQASEANQEASRQHRALLDARCAITEWEYYEGRIEREFRP